MAVPKTRTKSSRQTRASSTSPRQDIFGRSSPPTLRTYGRRTRSSPLRRQRSAAPTLSAVNAEAISPSGATSQAYEPLIIRPENLSYLVSSTSSPDLTLKIDITESITFGHASIPPEESVNQNTASHQAEEMKDLRRKFKEAVKEAEDAQRSLQILRQAQKDQATCAMCKDLMLLPYMCGC